MNTNIAHPKFSIIMPAYNAGRYLAEAIESVQQQTLTDWELWILDDASTDNTQDIGERFANQDPRIHYERLASLRKPASVRNVGIQKAQGQYLAFLDADDILESDALALYNHFFEKNPDSRAVYGQCVEINESSQRIRNGYAEAPVAPSWESLLTAQSHHQLQALALERSLMLELGGFNEDILFGEDWVFYLELLKKLGPQFGMIKTPVFQYRIYNESISRDSNRAKQVMYSLEDLCQWAMVDGNLPEEAKRYTSAFIAANYSYFFQTRVQHKQWPILTLALVRSFFNINFKTIDWMRCCWVIVKPFCPEFCQSLPRQLKQAIKPA